MSRPKSNKPEYRLAKRGQRYYVTWFECGTAQRVSTWTSDPTAAREWLAQFIAGKNAPTIPAQKTVKVILDAYIAARSDVVKHPANFIWMRKSLVPILGDLQPVHLTNERIQNYVAVRQRGRAKALSNGTIIRELTTLRNALQFAVNARWIAEVPYISLPKAPPPRKRWLNKAEVARLLEAAREPHVKVFIGLAVYTAARMSAALELTWDQVDFELGHVDLGEDQGNKGRALVPINPVLRAILAEAYAIRTSDFVVEYRGGRVRSVKNGVNAAAARAGIPNVTPHVFRHSAATWMVAAGVSFEKVAQFLGNTKEMVERVYAHFAPGFLQDATDALS